MFSEQICDSGGTNLNRKGPWIGGDQPRRSSATESSGTGEIGGGRAYLDEPTRPRLDPPMGGGPVQSAASKADDGISQGW